jgi:hypothetical protein
VQKSEISRYKYFSLNQNVQVNRHDGLMQDTMPIEEERKKKAKQEIFMRILSCTNINIHVSFEVENSVLFNVFQK